MSHTDKAFFTFSEAAEYLGIAKSTLYKFTASNMIPFSKPNGKIIYFSKKQLEDWVMSKCTNPELENNRAITYVTTCSE
jgi:excisionase family DNA binding protein